MEENGAKESTTEKKSRKRKGEATFLNFLDKAARDQSADQFANLTPTGPLPSLPRLATFLWTHLVCVGGIIRVAWHCDAGFLRRRWRDDEFQAEPHHDHRRCCR